jgi:hypothetical protein
VLWKLAKYVKLPTIVVPISVAQTMSDAELHIAFIPQLLHTFYNDIA